MVFPDDGWVVLETSPMPKFLVGPVINPSMEALDRRLSRSNIVLPPEIQPVAKHRILRSLPGEMTDSPSDDWFLHTLSESLIFVEKTGTEKDSQRAAAVHALIGHLKGRAGRPAAPIQLGGPIVCVDYSSQSLSIGNLFWTGIDFGETSHLGNKPRAALSEPGKSERNQCVILHLAAAYEWVLQGCPRRPPALSRVRTVGAQIRQEEYQQSLLFMESAPEPSTLRDFELSSSAHDALSAHHDRSFEDLNLFPIDMFKELNMALVVIELRKDSTSLTSRALVFSNTPDFELNRSMVLGVWGNHTRLLPPSSETLPSSWKSRTDTIGILV